MLTKSNKRLSLTNCPLCKELLTYPSFSKSGVGNSDRYLPDTCDLFYKCGMTIRMRKAYNGWLVARVDNYYNNPICGGKFCPICLSKYGVHQYDGSDVRTCKCSESYRRFDIEWALQITLK